MSSSKVEFAGTRGNRLAGVMELPDQAAPRAFAVFAHCFACGKNSLAATKISRALASRGIATLRFDFTGLGDSEGELGQAGITANVEDLVAAVHRMGATQGQPSLLVGHSLGGTAALLAARQLPQVKAVCTIGAPATAKHLLRQFKGAMVDAQGDWQVKLGGRDLSLSAEFIGELSNHASDAAASAGLGRALLVMHAPHDQVVGLEQAHALFSAASHPRSFVSLDDADHLLTRGADAGYVADVVSAWAGRYVDAAVQPPVPGPAELPGGSVWIGERDHAFWRTMRAGSHLLDADEPGEPGGAGGLHLDDPARVRQAQRLLAARCPGRPAPRAAACPGLHGVRRAQRAGGAHHPGNHAARAVERRAAQRPAARGRPVPRPPNARRPAGDRDPVEPRTLAVTTPHV